MKNPDVIIEDGQGNLWFVTPMNESARTWIRENTSEESQWWAGSLVVEARYLENFIEGMREDGLTVGPPGS